MQSLLTCFSCSEKQVNSDWDCVKSSRPFLGRLRRQRVFFSVPYSLILLRKINEYGTLKKFNFAAFCGKILSTQPYKFFLRQMPKKHFFQTPILPLNHHLLPVSG